MKVDSVKINGTSLKFNEILWCLPLRTGHDPLKLTGVLWAIFSSMGSNPSTYNGIEIVALLTHVYACRVVGHAFRYV